MHLKRCYSKYQKKIQGLLLMQYEVYRGKALRCFHNFLKEIFEYQVFRIPDFMKCFRQKKVSLLLTILSLIFILCISVQILKKKKSLEIMKNFCILGSMPSAFLYPYSTSSLQNLSKHFSFCLCFIYLGFESLDIQEYAAMR